MNDFGKVGRIGIHLLFLMGVVAASGATELWRAKHDLTLPACGPWLHNASETTMSISWITRQRIGAGLEYREKGAKDWNRRWKSLYGKMDYTSDIHTIHLTGLKPGTDYEYRLLSQENQYDTHVHKTFAGTETNAFRTLDRNRLTHSVLLTTDTHGDFRDLGEPLYDRLGGADCDLFVFLGDQVEDNQNQPRYSMTDGTLDAVTRLWGSSKPTVFVRGNHDCWGRHAAESWATYCGRPDNCGYFSFVHGPVLYVVLDVVEEYFKGRSEATDQVRDEYLGAQAAWFATLTKTPAWREATFRVVFCHYATRLGKQPSSWVRKMLMPHFSGKDGIHLYLCGHEHFHATSLPNTPGYFHDARYAKPGAEMPTYKYADGTADFTEVCGDKCGGFRLEVSPERLVIRVCDYVRKAGAPDFDAIEIRPDRSARRIRSR